MASLLSPRRTDAAIALRATVAHTERVPETVDDLRPPRVSWLLAASAGAGAAALSTWVILCGLAVLGWLAAAPGSFPGAMGVGTQLWLLSNGVGARLGSTTVMLVPWGVTLLAALLVSRFAAFAGRQGRRADALVAGWRAAGAVTGVVVLTYAAAVVVPALLLSSPTSLRGAAGATFIIAGAAAMGSCRGVGWAPARSWPAWCRAVPKAVLGAQLVLLFAGAAVLVVGLVLHLERVTELTSSLQAGLAGGVALWLAQVAYLPNAVCWAASYTLGAGFSLGQGSAVAPAATQLGLLPSVPMLGAVPNPGPGSASELWWLAAGVVAGAVSGGLALRVRTAARWDQSGLLGGLAGVLSGVVFALVAWASGGDLGTVRLTGLGPPLLPLLVMSVTTLGLSGMLVGLVLGVLRHPGGWRHASHAGEVADPPEDGDTDEPTIALDTRGQGRTQDSGVAPSGPSR